MFSAKVKLTGPTVKVEEDSMIPHNHKVRTITVDDKARERKFNQLLKVLRRQKCKVDVAKITEDGELIAIVTEAL